jgi:hypothetical protein
VLVSNLDSRVVIFCEIPLVLLIFLLWFLSVDAVAALFKVSKLDAIKQIIKTEKKALCHFVLCQL